jgi:tetratricopeptide (TPR) repeat protein|tara:strand:+ start:420 stop:1007 length:588 start_codon:yes stop_codon:yes gene_type:complete
MFIRLFKIALATASLVYTIILFIDNQIGNGIGMLLLTIILVMMTLRSIRMVIAFVNLRQQKMPEAKKWLSRVKVNNLWPNQRGYYYFLLGSLSMEENMNEAERLLKQAVSLGLKQSHDEAAAKLNLAVVASARRRLPEAMKLVKECKRLDTKGLLTKDIKMVEEALKGGGARAAAGRSAGSQSSARQQRRHGKKG